ncbi:acyltransferase family protein [Candidatus Palauibacter sp.]|uniref:acyltransferase family protein n=1 Tax=Candidatus Palauibacter sp. TaxID=3101350 RepID=UPI003B024F37
MRGLWSRAAAVAARTPESRNRYVDFLRALSIGAVVLGHWIQAAPYTGGGEVALSSTLEYQPWGRWLTWVLQVMPIFFMVGGYSNGVSWQSARDRGSSYAEWLEVRLRRLLGPVLALLAAWVLLGAGMGLGGVDAELVGGLSQMALIPVWFLAVYVLIVLLVPLTHAAWRRYGLWSFWVLVAAAIADDILFFAAGLTVVGWANYAFIWVAVHQLGYAWRDGQAAGPGRGAAWAALGGAALVGMVTLGPYPVSMVSVPGDAVSNSLPPKLPLLALALVHMGLLLSVEGPMRRWLDRAGPWTATVLVNGMIMTIFLWHLTAATLVVGVALLLGGVGLGADPAATGSWWAVRPLWLALYALALVPCALAFRRFERSRGGGRSRPGWMLAVGATVACAGLALLALGGIAAEGAGPLGLRLWVLALPFVGAALAGVDPLPPARGG